MTRTTRTRRVGQPSRHIGDGRMAEVLRTVDPLEYFRTHVRQGVRPDGRGLMRSRKPVLHRSPITSVDGSAMFRLGKTAVIAGVQCEPIPPQPGEGATVGDGPRGRIIVSLEVSAVSSPAASSALSSGGGGAGRLEREKAVLVELLQRTASGGMVDLSSLIVVEGYAVWSVCCDIVVLEDDGNLADVSMLAMMRALSRVRLPLVRQEESSGELIVIEEAAIPIVVSAPLYPVTFGVLCDEIILDPCAEEETLLATSFTLLLDDDGELVNLHKPGGAPLPAQCLPACLEAARVRLPVLKALALEQGCTQGRDVA